METIAAGANAITYTPPTNGELFRVKMEHYREIENSVAQDEPIDKKHEEEFALDE